MVQLTVKVSNDTALDLDAAAMELRRTRADIMRAAINQFLDDISDVSLALRALRDPADTTIPWEEARGQFLR